MIYGMVLYFMDPFVTFSIVCDAIKADFVLLYFNICFSLGR